MSDTVQPCGLQPARLLCSQDSLGKNTGVGCSALLQKVIPSQGSNLCLLHVLVIINNAVYLFKLMPLFSLDKCPKVEWLGHMIVLLIYFFEESSYYFPQWQCHFKNLSTVHKDSLFSIFFPTFIISCVLVIDILIGVRWF